MTSKPTTIERAMQLAATGRFAKVTEIKFALKREGYERVDAYFSGLGLYKQLREIMAAARAAAAPEATRRATATDR